MNKLSQISDAALEHDQWVRDIAAFVRRSVPGLPSSVDLVGAGYIGLMESLERWDPDGGSFRGYAYKRVRGAMGDWIRREQRLSRRAHEALARLEAHDALSGEGDAGGGAIDANTVRSLMRLAEAGAVATIAATPYANPWDGEGTEGAVHEQYEKRESIRRILEVVDTLPARQATAMRKHYTKGMAFTELAVEMGISTSRLSHLHAEALERIRSVLGVDQDAVSGESDSTSPPDV